MSEMIELILDDVDTRMDGAVSHARREMATSISGSLSVVATICAASSWTLVSISRNSSWVD